MNRLQFLTSDNVEDSRFVEELKEFLINNDYLIDAVKSLDEYCQSTEVSYYSFELRQEEENKYVFLLVELSDDCTENTVKDFKLKIALIIESFKALNLIRFDVDLQ